MDGKQTARLDRAECVARLATASVGRVVFTEGGMPAVLLVRFALDPTWRVVRIVAGPDLAAAVHNQVVAFQTDDVDPVRPTGWSVTVIGHARRRQGRTQEPMVVVTIERVIGESGRQSGGESAA